jgi:DNA-binding response OmpR family regulator
MMENRTLLLVEDDATYAAYIREAIRKARLPFTSQHVDSVSKALAYLRAESPYSDRKAYPMPAIVLLDLKLAERSGFPVLSWLRQNGQLSQIRVIILSASDHTQDVQQALDLGATSYLVKSHSSSKVTDLLGRLAVE